MLRMWILCGIFAIIIGAARGHGGLLRLWRMFRSLLLGPLALIEVIQPIFTNKKPEPIFGHIKFKSSDSVQARKGSADSEERYEPTNSALTEINFNIFYADLLEVRGGAEEILHKASEQETILGVVPDISTRTFCLLGNHGSQFTILCESIEEFMNVLKHINSHLDPGQIEHADPAIQNEE